jgi:acyl transferase domain-containing protein/thioesterase domain-containing protein/NAD(P)-dependent dehydrogenase (short-subunit alcohol dehydrogenase family)/acyl carrier protein
LTEPDPFAIAIVGMAAHLPGAADIAAYWANLRAGLSAIRRLTEAELAAEDPGLATQPNYVPFAAPLDGFAGFDAEFFGFSPKEAAILDPQHRRFLEVAWAALENAACDPQRHKGRIGVYAGCGQGTYFWVNLLSNPDLVADVGHFLLRHTGNDKDFLATRVSHVFDLRGPSVNIQTACSTSLVAIHHAAQALLTGECDVALAGGVTIELPQARGYLYKENEILSPDGACHAFDHRAQGTVFGSGAGVVALRRLADAVRDGDHIWAVIRGTAINNDGAQKAGYLAPSVEGQAACVAEALAVAGTPAETVDYVECHGTGTYLGDPIEVAALTQAFRESTQATGFARIGSVKTNIGHLDTAAGVASVIKTALALHHAEMPPSLGYEAPNPAIDFDGSPFRVNDRLTPWDGRGTPRRAGVNSLGVGGTNAHAILEEAPPRAPSDRSDWPFQILTLSARSKPALDGAARALAAHFRAHPDINLADAAWTLHAGRKAFDRRCVVVATDPAEAAALLDTGNPRRVFDHTALANPDVVFMFPGGGAQYPGMARDLYATEPVFADWMDRGLAHLQPKLDYDLRALWLPERGHEAAAAEALKRPSVQLPLIFITEIALAQMLMGWGLRPAALIGHSMGQNAAACLAGVMGFEDGIDLVHLRGRLFDTVPSGGMLSVPLSLAALEPHLGDLDIASLNAPDLTVVSGPDAALADLAARLAGQGIETQRIAIDIAAHSRMLDPILPAFRAHLAQMRLEPPRLPIISNRTGTILTDAEAISPDYWTAHLRGTVRFADGIATLAQRKARIYLEVGPGKALSSLAKMSVPSNQVLAALRHPEEAIADDLYHLGLLGRIWALGGSFDWGQIWGEARRVKLPLPGYAFQRSEYYIAPAAPQTTAKTAITRAPDLADWGWKPVWRPEPASCELEIDAGLGTPRHWLILADTVVAPPVIARLRAGGHRVTEVRLGAGFARHPLGYTLDPGQGRASFDRLVQDLTAKGDLPQRIALAWPCAPAEGPGTLARHTERGFYALTFLAQAWADEGAAPPELLVALTAGAHRLRGAGGLPEAALIAGPARMIPRELGWPVALLDLPPVAHRREVPALVAPILEEMLSEPATGSQAREAALRGGRRLGRALRAAPLPAPVELPQGAVWVITGGLGGIGLQLAQDLIHRTGARVVLIARQTPAPASARGQALAQLQTLGQATLIEADVCNIDQMRRALDRIRADIGPIHGVIHAAGAIDDGPLMTRTVAGIEAVLAPKVHGLRVLDALLPDGAVEVLVLFSSTSTLTAPAGQTDYIAANDYLNAYARAREGGKTRVLALNWGIWAEVGMAAGAMAERLGTAAEATPVALPVLTGATYDPDRNRRFSGTLSPADWLLDEHRTADGRALVPGTGMLEIAAQALRAQGEAVPFEIRDLAFFRPLEVDTPRGIRATLVRSDQGYRFELRAAQRAQGRDGWVLIAQATVALGHMAPTTPLDPAAIAARCPRDIQESAGGIMTAQEAHLRFGPRWRVLNRTAFGAGEGIAHLSLPAPFRADLAQGWVLHPALMDLATGWAMPLIAGYEGRSLWVPVGYDRVAVHAPLPAEIVSHARLVPADPGFARFDLTLAAPDGRVLVQIAGFTMKRLEGGFGATPAPAPSEMAFDTVRALAPAESRLQRNLALGIRPSEGFEALTRALAQPEPVIAVSSIPLPALIAEAEARDDTPAEGQKFDRPALDSAYVAPRNDLERTLAGFWEELLGVQGVGVDDSFFDLGGHSLIAVRLFARIKKAFAVEFPISVLFEAPSVAKVAALIAARTGIVPAEGAAPARAPRRFDYLVPMHEGEGGPRTPFVLVAGMFGNVLNLRALAMLLGRDRPFYGLQARGLAGDAAPHARLDDAARDYIAELRQVQPHGPYLLGGFSGGGLTALEMAHRLREAGEEVALLTLLDTPVPLRRPLSRPDKVLIKLAEFRRKGLGYAREWAQARRDWAEAQRWAQPETSLNNQRIEQAFRDALPHVRLRPYAGRTALFRPPLDRHWRVGGERWVSAAREYVSADNDWGPWMPALSVHEVPGDHDSMVLEPNVRVMAAELARLIAEVGQ